MKNGKQYQKITLPLILCGLYKWIYCLYSNNCVYKRRYTTHTHIYGEFLSFFPVLFMIYCSCCLITSLHLASIGGVCLTRILFCPFLLYILKHKDHIHMYLKEIPRFISFISWFYHGIRISSHNQPMDLDLIPFDQTLFISMWRVI